MAKFSNTMVADTLAIVTTSAGVYEEGNAKFDFENWIATFTSTLEAMGLSEIERFHVLVEVFHNSLCRFG